MLPGMFREIPKVRQEPGRHRRWFEDDLLNLIVWLDPKGGVEGFQLCRGSHALTWRGGAGFSQGRVDEGDESPLKNLTPIVVPDATVPWDEMTAEFRARSATLEAPLRELILGRLQERK